MRVFLTISFLILPLIITNCNMMEPVHAPGNLQIQLIPQNQQSMTQMAKTGDLLSDVYCVVKNGSDIVFNDDLSYQGGKFKGNISNLAPGDDYSVVLYGVNGQDEVIGYGSEYGLSIEAGETKVVSLYWGDFRPVLVSPTDGKNISTFTPAFSWQAVNGALKYDISVYHENNTRVTNVLRDSTLTRIEYTGTLTYTADVSTVTSSSIKYGWRVRCQDREGVWGAWSEQGAFYVAFNSIRVMSPNGGEKWEIGSRKKIMWESTSSDDVDIKLYKGTTLYKVLEYTYGNTGVYDWVISDDIAAGDRYKVRVFTKSSSAGDDRSDDFFSIID